MIEENKIKESWPSAVEGSIEHPDFGIIKYWTGEQNNRIVVRFSYEGQIKSESEIIFFINVNLGDWVLSQISTFKSSDSKLKLTKIQSFKEYEDLENKYLTIIELFMKSRKSRKFF